MNAREELKKIPAVCRVLVEYEKTHSNKTAREMWEILLDQIVNAGFVKFRNTDLMSVKVEEDKIIITISPNPKEW